MPNLVPRQKYSPLELGHAFWELPTPGRHPTITSTYIWDEGFIASDGHYGWPNPPPNKTDVGGGLDLRTSYTECGYVNPGKIFAGGGLSDYGYEGNHMCWYSRIGSPSAYSPNAWGATAYARMKPTKPNFQALNFVYEMKDIPGMLRQRMTNNGLQNIGNYYLALKFGWEPLVRDLRNLVSVQRNAEKRLAQLLRDNGRPVRRRVELAHSVTPGSWNPSGYSTGGNTAPGFVSSFYRKPGLWTQQDITTDRVWASSRVRYWLPDGPRDIAWKRKMLANLYGLTPTPSVIYNMMPWSWLVDWFSNTGDIISNMDAGVADRLSYDWCYVMREMKTERICTGESHFFGKGGTHIDVSLQSKCTSSSRQRGHGDPFGWNTPQNSLSSMQLSILGALGLSRLR